MLSKEIRRVCQVGFLLCGAQTGPALRLVLIAIPLCFFLQSLRLTIESVLLYPFCLALLFGGFGFGIGFGFGFGFGFLFALGVTVVFGVPRVEDLSVIAIQSAVIFTLLLSKTKKNG